MNEIWIADGVADVCEESGGELFAFLDHTHSLSMYVCRSQQEKGER